MAIRSHDLKPMTTSGHCAWGKDHSLCHKDGCTCSCHIVPNFLAGIKDGIAEGNRATRRKTRKKLI